MFCISEFQDPLRGGESNLLCSARVAWKEVATWMNAYLISEFLDSDSELQQSITEKINHIPLIFGSMIKVFFGDQNASAYTDLFSNYLMHFINLINAQKSGDINMVNEYKKQLYENVEQKADFLSKINPFWLKNELLNLMHSFTNMLIDQIAAFSTKDYNKSINLYDKISYYSSQMGDYLAKGILNYLTYSDRQPIKL